MKSKEFEQFLQNLTPKLHQTSNLFTVPTTANNYLTTSNGQTVKMNWALSG